ncbi:FecR family protein [Parapedobacter sp. ISTM3]|uniref:FecR family protein n=1 Tax=Parapedobacter sp. ISTM3 TaxID=2800130 RepID=UPI001F161B10|nr:FecR family protein [Parapedobacter sp. ISTM3]
MEHNRAKELLERYRSGLCSAEEREMVESHFARYIRDNDQLPSLDDWIRVERNMYEAMQARIHRPPFNGRLLWMYSAAALVIVSAVALLFYSLVRQPSAEQHVAGSRPADVDPGTERAVLTLADGRKIALDEAGIGQLATEGGVIINKTADGQILYEANEQEGSALAFNTVETPKGGYFKIVLPDGTGVWLNAASLLKYPNHFSGHERRVELQGEAYFEVASQYSAASERVKMPFVVATATQEVEVLGTQFNLNAYPDEPDVKTTLLEGTVRVSDREGRLSKTLRPGEQAVFAGGELLTHPVDAEAAVAWKNNLFLFYHADLATIIRQIERWYDVEFDYASLPKTGRLYGEISRDKKLSVVLAALSEYTGLHFDLEGRRVAVIP